MDPRLLARIYANGGLITRRDALGAGLTEETIARLLRTGEWVLVRRGVYARAVDWNAWDDYVERPRRRARAVALCTTTPFVLSHDSAAHEHGLAILRPSVQLVHVTRPGCRSAQVRNGIKHHGARYDESQIEIQGGIPLLGRARTAVDMAREYGVRGGLPTFDAALRAGVTRAELANVVEQMRGWPDVAAPRVCLELADPGAESVAESLMREFVIELALGEPETQFPIRIADGRVMWCDLRVGCHMFEFDGKVKFTPRSDGGVADRPLTAVLWDERTRERDVCAEGVGMSRLVWADLWGEARERAKVRVRREYYATVARHGHVLPARLAEFAARVRGNRVRSA